METNLLLRRSQQNGITLIIYLLLLFTSTLLVLAKIDIVGPSFYDSLSSVTIILLTMIVILKYDTHFFLLYFLGIYGYAMVAFSTTLIEGGAYMIEIFESGYPTGSTARFVCYVQLFTLGCYIAYYALRRSKLPYHYTNEFTNNRLITKIFNILFIGLLGALALILLLYGSPLTSGLGRTQYWTYVAPPITRYLNSFLPQLNFINGILYTQTTRKYNRKLAIGLFIASLAIQFLQGEKFSGLLLSGYFFALPSLFQQYKFRNIPIKAKYVFMGIGLALLAFASIFIGYTLQLGSSETGLLMFTDRLSLQGQVWWATERLTSNDVEGTKYFVRHLLGIGAEVTEKGLNYLMFLVAPPAVATAYFEAGSGFTAGFPSIVLLGTGYLWGVPAILLCGMFMGLVLYVFSLALIRKKVLFSFFVLKIFFATYLAFAMGDIHLLVSLKYFAFFFFAAVLFYPNIVLFRAGNQVVKI